MRLEDALRRFKKVRLPRWTPGLYYRMDELEDIIRDQNGGPAAIGIIDLVSNEWGEWTYERERVDGALKILENRVSLIEEHLTHGTKNGQFIPFHEEVF